MAEGSDAGGADVLNDGEKDVRVGATLAGWAAP